MAESAKRSFHDDFDDDDEDRAAKRRRSRWQDAPDEAPEVASEPSAAEQLAALQAQIQAQMSNVKTMLEQKKRSNVTSQEPAGFGKPVPLLLDKQGREIDTSGKVIAVKKETVATLMVNRTRETEFVKEVLPMLETDPTKNPFFDPNMKAPTGRREKRPSFKFVDEGTFRKAGENLRSKISKRAATARFGQTQSTVGGSAYLAAEKAAKEAAAAAQAMEVESDAVVGDPAASNQDKPAPASVPTPIVPFKKEDPIPEIEWWDAVLQPEYTDGDVTFNETKVTHLVEHPIPIEPVCEAPDTGPVPLPLTPREQKKIRTRNRIDTEKEKQAQIRMGLLPPPPPKVKISNMMKALLNEAVQDPSKIEQQVREEMAQRQRNHDLRNAERKLTPEERRQKKLKKYADEISVETQVALFRVEDFSNPQHRYKVDINASQLHLTGAVVICDETGCNAVIAEGGSRSIKKFTKLLLSRIKWGGQEGQVEEPDDDDAASQNKTTLIWQGVVKKPNFKNFHLEECRSEGLARKFLHDKNVEHYWDMCKKHNINAALQT